ncbi:hypothetical protein [Kitasatospora sp. NPDC051914]|uniref:hypothetical protein n=1 Tax=Kitasatospora sp. NPDC051914 TaxID=3154945 RepID=UPI00341DDB6E
MDPRTAFDPHNAQPSPPRASVGTGVCGEVEGLAAEAERLMRDGLWELAPGDAVLALRTASGLAKAVGPADRQAFLPSIDRLEQLREAMAVLAIGIARTHGQLAWFLSRASTALAPVLHWRTLPADPRQAFGTVVPTPGELTDAEDAVRRLQAVLDHAAAATPIAEDGSAA